MDDDGKDWKDNNYDFPKFVMASKKQRIREKEGMMKRNTTVVCSYQEKKYGLLGWSGKVCSQNGEDKIPMKEGGMKRKKDNHQS